MKMNKRNTNDISGKRDRIKDIINNRKKDVLDSSTKEFLCLASQVEFQMIREKHIQKIKAIKTNTKARAYIMQIQDKLAAMRKKTT